MGSNSSRNSPRRLVMVGCGALGCAVLEVRVLLLLCLLTDVSQLMALPYWERRVGTWDEIVVIEPRARSHLPELRAYPQLRYIQEAVREHKTSVVTDELTPGSVCLDVSVGVDAVMMLRLCRKADCLYLNTSMEVWNEPDVATLETSREALDDRSLFRQMQEARSEATQWKEKHHGDPGPTAIVDHGMNPGLITHFALFGLRDYARKKRATADNDAELAKALGLRVIHVSERDTQLPVASFHAPDDLFVNTWSGEGFLQEARDPVQLGYGTHEHVAEAVAPIREGKRANVRFLQVRGMDFMLSTHAPARTGKEMSEFYGFAIPHGESNTLSKRLETADGSYRPSVYYVYKPSPMAELGIGRVRKNGYEELRRGYHVLRQEEIASGYDAVGAMLHFENGDTWWSGTVLDVEDLPPLHVYHSGPTVVQVAVSFLAALSWALSHPRKGMCTAEQLPSEKILADTAPFLGRLVSKRGPSFPASFDYGFQSFRAKETHGSK